jgi:arylsulfatase
VGKAPVAKTVRPPKQYARPQRQSGGQPPNILLITIDALRADRLHCYGYRRKTSPILDQLAEEGTLFLDTTSVGATTVNTVPTLLTGQHPGENGLVWREQQGQLSPKPEDSCPTIAEMLLEHGYATGLVTSNPLVGEPMGLAKGFDVLDLSPSEGNVWLYSQAKYINTRALEWLDQLDQKQPFFLYLHYLEPHNQYRPPSEFCVFGRPGYTARDDAVNNTANLLQDKVEPPITDADLRKDDLSIQDITRLRDLYDNEILCVDHYLGQLFDQLKQLDRFDNTIIVLTADHGEAFLEHGYLEHDKSLYQEMVHIPLLIRGPGVPAGRRSKAVVSQADIVPTLLDLLGITPAVKMSGATLRPLLNNETTAPTSLALTQIPSQKTSALRQGSLKLIVTGSNKELYDLSRDPGEKTNLAAKEAEKVRQLSGILDATLAKQTIRRSQQASPSPSHDRALRSLGYLR